MNVIVDDEDGVPTIRRGQGVHFLHGSRPEQSQEVTPGKAGMIEKAINGVLAGKGVIFAALQQTKLVLLMKQQHENELKQSGWVEAKSFAKSGLLQKFHDVQFLKTSFTSFGS
ncbi:MULTISPECIES: hypothetical protein [Paenibacillus]|uniref:Uncharacterized protein n=1 Tax=Paenibacillus lautus TaxID=1401 RepID=A0A1R1AU73_PAELA|nr:hypothetical protein [Paenibacillus lautus]OME89127.1 hypothetical protein BK123_27535 [Paenibacillus lautus]